MDRPESCTLDIGCIDMRLAGLSQAIMRTTDPYTARHQDRVAVIASAVGRELGLPPLRCKLLHYAGIVHDLGKVAIPSEILNKPGRLSHPEIVLIRTHVEHGVHILRDAGFCARVLDVVALHHEYLDGSGYPVGPTADSIPIEARILTVADIYEAMTARASARRRPSQSCGTGPERGSTATLWRRSRLSWRA